MLKSLKVVFLILILVVLSVVINEVSTYDYLYPEYHIDIDEVAVKGSNSILIQGSNSIKPVKYLGTLDFDTIPESIRKVIFINYMLPAIVIEHDRLLNLMRHVEFIEQRMVNKRRLRKEDLQFFKEMMEKYDATSIKDLKIRLYPTPVSLVLAQATLESGWGTSNVFSRANNPFGIMSFSSEEQRRKFLNPEQQTEAYYRSYSDVNQSVEHYFLFTARLASYEKFRKKRWERGSSIAMVNLLKNYHETDEYATLVASIINKNDYIKYDNVTINKEYFQYKKNYFQLVKSYFEDNF